MNISGKLYRRHPQQYTAGEDLVRGDPVVIIDGVAFRNHDEAIGFVSLWEPWSNEHGPATVKKGEKFWLWSIAKSKEDTQ